MYIHVYIVRDKSHPSDNNLLFYHQYETVEYAQLKYAESSNSRNSSAIEEVSGS